MSSSSVQSILPCHGEAECQTPTWQFGLKPERYGYANALQAIAPISQTKLSGQNRIEYTRENLVEWYVNDHRGLEQGFTIQQRPHWGGADCELQDTGSSLQLVLSWRGNLQAKQAGHGPGRCPGECRAALQPTHRL